VECAYQSWTYNPGRFGWKRTGHSVPCPHDCEGQCLEFLVEHPGLESGWRKQADAIMRSRGLQPVACCRHQWVRLADPAWHRCTTCGAQWSAGRYMDGSLVRARPPT
jgi:hypothetical protein